MKTIFLLAATIALALVGFAVYSLAGRGGDDVSSPRAKPAAPFSVALVQTAQAGPFRTLEVHVSTQVDLVGAELSLVPFDGLAVVEPASPIIVDLRAGDSARYTVRVRLNPSGGGAFTAELTGRFPDGSSRVASDSVRFAAGEAVRADAKIPAPAPGPVRVQEVPAAPRGAE